MGGMVPRELQDLKTCPESLQEVWEWFCDLDLTRNAGFGYSMISFVEMQAYFDFMKIVPSRTELAILRKLDVTKGRITAENQKKKNKNDKPK